MIQYVTGDATAPIGSGPKIIAHITNNSGGWGRGFVRAVSRKWQVAEAFYRGKRLHQLGDCDLIDVEPGIWVANLCAQDGYASSECPVAVSYKALGTCLDALCPEALEIGATVHCPRIGCGLGGGRWETVSALLTQRLCANGVPVVVYDL